MTEFANMTDKRRVFIEEYLICWNGTEAARRANYAHPRQEASRLLSNADIAGIVAARIQEKAMSADEVLGHLADVARFDIGSVIGKGGVLDLDKAKSEGYTSFLSKLKWTKAGIEIEAYDKMHALELIGKHMAMWVERHEVTGKDGEPLTSGLERALDRAFDRQVPDAE